jgi:diphosphomevalonate decarboxylase
MVDWQIKERDRYQMAAPSITAIAHPNIALIKYWGNRDPSLRLPANGSISITLENLETRTSVEFSDSLKSDQITINDKRATGEAFTRVQEHLNRIRILADVDNPAMVRSNSTFPQSAGLASSASGFAALSLAATNAVGLDLSMTELSILARKASGSACRSIFGGFVEWHVGEDDRHSFAEKIAERDHWDLIDVIALVSEAEKDIGSTSGHAAASSSPLQSARVADAPRRLELCRKAILNRDFSSLAKIVEEDSNMMHAVMLTSSPPILYWEPATLTIMHQVQSWRAEGLQVCYTIDAGANVHCICTSASALEVQRRLGRIEGVTQILTSKPGGPARLVP